MNGEDLKLNVARTPGCHHRDRSPRSLWPFPRVDQDPTRVQHARRIPTLFRRKWTDVHLQGKEMGWIGARDAPGFIG